jgi:ABC-2 type transport system ATP-binding protein
MGKGSIIEVTNLSKSFGSRKVIDDISLTVEEGEVFGFLGPNGSGKTTTIRMLLNLIHADEGSVWINGYNLKTDFNKAIEKVGAIVETPKFHPYLSGRGNLKLMANLVNGISPGRVESVLKLVGLSGREDDKVKTYSLGMRQRLGIANALLGSPRLVILDEPTNGLDPQGMKEIRDLIIDMALKEKITFFISSHLLHEVEQICSSVAILNGGRIIAQGRVKDLLNVSHETIDVFTPSLEEAFSISEGLDFVKGVEKTARGITVRIEKGYGAQLNRCLVNSGIDVEYVIPRSRSLEEFFIELVEGGEADAEDSEK